MWKSVALLLTAVCAGCAAEQPEKNRYVAAVEISLKSAADRAELIAILRRHAAADEDLHVDDVSDRWRKFEAETKTSPGERGTIFVGLGEVLTMMIWKWMYPTAVIRAGRGLRF